MLAVSGVKFLANAAFGAFRGQNRPSSSRESRPDAPGQTNQMAHIERPISPHLSVYKLTLTMAMSIIHRATGIALYVGTLLLVWWLLATATGASAYATFQGFIGSWFGRLILLLYTWALMHHLLSGLRHLIWDLGYGFAPNDREWLTRAALIGSIALTIVLWVIAYGAGGLR